MAPEAAAPAPADLQRVPVAFVRVLRGAGLDVPVGATVAYGQALAALADRGTVGAYWAGRSTLVRRVEDVPAYDRAFASFFGDGIGPARGEVTRVLEVVLDADDGDDAPAAPDDDEQDDDGAEVLAVRWSPVEVLAAKDLAACTPEELLEAHRLVAELRLRAALRPSRRRRPDHRPRPGGRVDLRRTVAAAVRHGGEIGRPATTSPGERPRRVVLLLDVSGSMAPYARALARFAHAAVAARRRGQVEVFALGTRLTRITRQLATHDPDAAITAAAASVADWDGGTRLGHGLRAFNDQWGVRGMARGAIVVVLSDGWDRGEPEELAAEMARLGRTAHRLVWLNPLAASPSYEPLTRGMQAALPHADDFLPGNSLRSLVVLADLMETIE